jgi:hypothetical protein
MPHRLTRTGQRLRGVVQRLCKDHDEQCAAWAAVPGECERNQDFMWSRCQGSCHICMIDNLMAKSFQELALYSLRNAVRALADAGPVRVPPELRPGALDCVNVERVKVRVSGGGRG